MIAIKMTMDVFTVKKNKKKLHLRYKKYKPTVSVIWRGLIITSPVKRMTIPAEKKSLKW